jgi:hypothetical protein
MKACVPTCRRRKRSNALWPARIHAGGPDKKTARPAKDAPFFFWTAGQGHYRATTTVSNRLNDTSSGTDAAGKKIPALRRANDTLFNVSERSAH